MNAERWQQIDELLDSVLEIPHERREAFLSEKCCGDDDLKKEVLSLLKAQKESDAFLEKSAMNLMAKEIAHDQTTVADFSILGRELGNYRVERPLGAGGMGEVYLAHDSKLNRKVALKILPAEFVLDGERVKRFEREAKAVSALNHPNIVTIYDFGQTDGINFIVTEYIEGVTVRELIKTNPSLKETLHIVSQACEALAAAHSSGIIHRDIKPENIMVRPDGYVKVLDFGLAKLNPQADSIHVSLTNYTQKGMVIGTLAYMSPEQVSDENVDHRTDLWSLGVVLYEMLTGVNPFKGENRQATLNAILTYNPPTVSESNPSLSAELDRILEKALEKDADVSYQTASDIRADLKRVRREIDSSPSLRTNSTSGKGRKITAEKKRNYLLPAFGVLGLALLGFGIWFFALHSRPANAVDWSKATNIQLTEQAGTEFYPALAPDGKSFVYASKTTGNYDLYLQRIGGKNAQNLTKDSTEDEKQPVFSPDGSHIAFRSEREPRGIYIMEATGENVRRVADFGFYPSWSPDGKEIVVSETGRDFPQVRNNTPSNLWRISVATGEKRRIFEGDAEQPAWSPDGRRVAFVFMQKGGRRDIATIPADGGESVVVTKDASTNWCPVWSPDGKFLYYASDKSGNMNFWRVALDETGQVASESEAVVTPSKYSHHLAFSRDGKRLIYVQTDRESNIQAVEFDAEHEKLIGEPFSITRGTREIGRAVLSPDGTQFVVRLPRRTQDDIAVVSRDGNTWRDLTNDTAFDRYPRWSPDGKRIAFVSDRSGNYEIWIIDADGTNLRQITFTAQIGTSFPVFSPDGNRLLYRQNTRNYIIDLNKNWTEQTPPSLPPLENAESNFVVWDWSPDGKKLAGTFSGNKTAVGFYSFETNRYEKVADGDVSPMWLSDNRRFVFPNNGKAFIADTITKKSHELISRSNGDIFGVNLDATNRLLYYTVLSVESDIWLLDMPQNQ